jgi:release factor glutamine methyltransferase
LSVDEIIARLLSAGVENARLEAEWLCARFAGTELADAVRRRCEGYPLQYLLGEWDFYRQTYEVGEACLIPRADTEILVEKAIALLPQGAQFLGLCTGSGCIAVSTLCERPDTSGVAIDLFDPTLALAERNARRNGVGDRLRFLRADVLQPAPHPLCEARFDAVLSNPPYIRSDVMPTLQKEVRHEPFAALCGGKDGLDFYRAILEGWRTVLKKEGFFLFEIGYDQGEALRTLGAAYGFNATVYRDYGGNDRVVLLKR